MQLKKLAFALALLLLVPLSAFAQRVDGVYVRVNGNGQGVSRELYWELTNLATTAGSTTWVTTGTYSLPGTIMWQNGDRIRIELNITWGTAATDQKNITCGLGFSSFSSATGAFTGGVTSGNASTSNTGTISQHITIWWTRLAAASLSAHEMNLWEGNATSQSVAYSTGATVTWTNPNSIMCAVGNSTGGNTETITINEMRIFYEAK